MTYGVREYSLGTDAVTDAASQHTTHLWHCYRSQDPILARVKNVFDARVNISNIYQI